MFKKIADQTTNSSALEALKQRYVLIDTYNRLKDNLKTTEDLYNTLVNNQESREEVSNYVFKCEWLFDKDLSLTYNNQQIKKG